jgi:uncharacterized RDD family membrane protein YckC
MSNSIYILDEKLLASGGTRFLNYILDVVFILILIFASAFVLAILSNLLGWTGLLMWMSSMSDLDGQLLFFGFFIFYYVFFEGLFGRSIGKFITGTIVVDENGEKPGFATILGRTLCRIIPFDALSFLGSRGWHDSLSNTYVAHKKELAKDLKTFNEFSLIGGSELE